MNYRRFSGADERFAPRRLPESWLTPEDVEEFKQLYEAEFGGKLSDGEAQLMILRVMELYLLLSRPLPGKPKERRDAEPEP